MKHKGIICGILAYELGKRLVKDASAGKCQTDEDPGARRLIALATEMRANDVLGVISVGTPVALVANAIRPDTLFFYCFFLIFCQNIY